MSQRLQLKLVGELLLLLGLGLVSLQCPLGIFWPHWPCIQPPVPTKEMLESLLECHDCLRHRHSPGQSPYPSPRLLTSGYERLHRLQPLVVTVCLVLAGPPP